MAKVLFVEHPEAMALGGMLYLGLRELFGDDNVVDYPYKPSYHGKLHLYPSPYENPIGDPTLVGQTGCTGPFSWMTPSAAGAWSREDVIANMRLFDLIIVPPRKGALLAMRDLVSVVGLGNMPPRVVLDDEDYHDIHWDLYEEFAARRYFKRELFCDSASRPSVFGGPWPALQDALRPLPLSATARACAPRAKDIDVSFFGTGTWPGRASVCDALHKEFGGRFVGGVGFKLDVNSYMEALSRSKIGISIRGHAYDAMRFWDVPSFDTLLISDRLPISKPHPFVDGEHAVYYDDIPHLLRLVRQYLDDDVARMRIAEAGNRHLRQYHTTRARAEYFLQEAGL